MSIASTETWFIDRLKARFEPHLRTVESLPADFDDEAFERMLREAPGIYVVFNGGARSDAYGESLVIDARWSFFAVTGHQQGDLARRHGDAREIGAYQMLELMTGVLEGAMPPDAADQMRVLTIGNVFSEGVDYKGATAYVIECGMDQGIGPSAEGPVDPALDDFVTFHGDIDLAKPDGQIDAADTLTLPQGP